MLCLKYDFTCCLIFAGVSFKRNSVVLPTLINSKYGMSFIIVSVESIVWKTIYECLQNHSRVHRWLYRNIYLVIFLRLLLWQLMFLLVWFSYSSFLSKIKQQKKFCCNAYLFWTTDHPPNCLKNLKCIKPRHLYHQEVVVTLSRYFSFSFWSARSILFHPKHRFSQVEGTEHVSQAAAAPAAPVAALAPASSRGW